MQQQCDQATSAIEPLLKALWLSEFQGRLNSYRTAIILLADVGLEFGMTKRSRRILEEIMPQVCELFFVINWPDSCDSRSSTGMTLNNERLHA
jgi:hypothetical protein